MKKTIFYLIVCIFQIACAPVYRMDYSYKLPASHAGKMCVNQCLQAKSVCEEMCAIRIQGCQMQARQEALYQYQVYIANREIYSRPVSRNLNDFDNSFFLCPHQCNCINTYNICYQTCGGNVQVHKTCTAFCKQPEVTSRH